MGGVKIENATECAMFFASVYDDFTGSAELQIILI